MFVGVLAALAPGTITIEAGSGNISPNNWTSSTYTTPAGCVTIVPLVSLTSQRGNGASQYYYRSIKWRVEYWDGSAWTPLAWRIVNMGAQFSAITDSGPFNFPSAAAWQWRIYAEQYDTDGTVFGSMQYTYDQETVYQSSGNGYQSLSPAASQALSGSCSITLGAKTKSGEIYQINYAWSASVQAVGSTFGSYSGFDNVFDNNSCYSSQPSNHYSVPYRSGTPSPSGYVKTDNYPASGHHRIAWTRSNAHVVSGSNLTYTNTITASLYYRRTAGVYADINTTLSAGSATIYYRTPAANSTTPINNTYINSYDYA